MQTRTSKLGAELGVAKTCRRVNGAPCPNTRCLWNLTPPLKLKDGGVLLRVISATGAVAFEPRWKRVMRNKAASLNAEVDQSHEDAALNFHGVHHVGLLCSKLETSLAFYRGVIDLEINPDRPDDKLPYRGAWLWIGSEMIHLMELPNPDPKDGRPEHGGRDRHFCVGIESLDPLVEKLKNAGVKYTESVSGRRAVFFRDPDMNCLEVFETKGWR